MSDLHVVTTQMLDVAHLSRDAVHLGAVGYGRVPKVRPTGQVGN